MGTAFWRPTTPFARGGLARDDSAGSGDWRMRSSGCGLEERNWLAGQGIRRAGIVQASSEDGRRGGTMRPEMPNRNTLLRGAFSALLLAVVLGMSAVSSFGQMN